MEFDMSITSMMTALLRGIRISCVGVARAIVSRARLTTATARGRCRHRDWDISASVYRRRRVLRRAWTSTYTAIRPSGIRANNNMPGRWNPYSGKGPTPGSDTRLTFPFVRLLLVGGPLPPVKMRRGGPSNRPGQRVPQDVGEVGGRGEESAVVTGKLARGHPELLRQRSAGPV